MLPIILSVIALLLAVWAWYLAASALVKADVFARRLLDQMSALEQRCAETEKECRRAHAADQVREDRLHALEKVWMKTTIRL